MFLIDEPFVSNFLINTVRNNKYQIISTRIAKKLITDESLNWIDEEEAVSILKNNPQTPLYSNSENALSWIEQNLRNSELANQTKSFKDKTRFRTILKNIFPDFYFKEIKLEDVDKLSPQDLSFPFVIKPSVGFFSIGVHIVKNKQDWVQAKNELRPENLKSIFPKNVLNTSNFIMEEFIQGEEFAIDYYHDKNGDVIILNIMQHLFSSGTDTSDRVYFTSKEIIEEHENNIGELLYKIGQEINLKNFPAHAEVRIDKKGKIVPIEINPLRFGGLCTTGDLMGLTLGFNSYKCFFEANKPDWKTIFSGKEDKILSLIVLDNNSGVEAADISNFNYSELAKDFENPISIREFDIQKFPVFGFVFAETSKQNQKELDDVLTSDLKKYIMSRPKIF